MRIKQLSLAGFSSHVHTGITFERMIAIVVGGVNAGKSSLLQGIEYALTDECGFHRKTTDNRIELIHDLSSMGAMTVGLVTDKGTIRRSKTREGVDVYEWNDKNQPSAAAIDTAISAAIGVSRTVMSSVFNTGDFFNLDIAIQKKIVIGLIGAEITDSKVRALFSGEAAALGLITGELDSLAALDNSYDYVYKRRTIVKREKDDLKPANPPEGPRPPLEAIKLKLTELETELKVAISEKGKAEGSGSNRKLMNGLQEQIAELKKVPDGPLPEKISRLEIDLTKAKGKVSQAGTNYGPVNERYTNAKMALTVAMTKRDSLKEFSGKCVFADVKCGATEQELAGERHKAEMEVNKLNKDVVDLANERRQLEATRDDRSEIERVEADLAKAKQQREAHVQRQASIKRLHDQISQIPAFSQDDDAVAKSTEKIQALEERIAKGREKLTNAQSWVERDLQVAFVADKRKDVETELAYLESLCEFFGKNGVKVSLIDEKIANFESAINAHLKAFGFEIKIQVEPWRVLAKGRPLSRLSASERFRLGIAFQIGIAKLTGLNIVICDGAEILPQAEFGTMISMLASAGLDQAIIIRTLQTPLKDFLEKKPSHPMLEYLVVTNLDGVSQVERLI